jgi:hypothetical protein
MLALTALSVVVLIQSFTPATASTTARTSTPSTTPDIYVYCCQYGVCSYVPSCSPWTQYSCQFGECYSEVGAIQLQTDITICNCFADTCQNDAQGSYDLDAGVGRVYMSVLATPTTTGTCSDVTDCTLGSTYQSVAPTITSNTVCSPITSCTVGVNFQSAAPTLTTDRVCANAVTSCALGQTWQSAAATVTSNTVCTNVTACVFNVT